jgi:sodium-dependent phosphate transporter
MLVATVMEFTGALTVGARVSDTIRTKIVSPLAFESEPVKTLLLHFAG